MKPKFILPLILLTACIKHSSGSNTDVIKYTYHGQPVETVNSGAVISLTDSNGQWASAIIDLGTLNGPLMTFDLVALQGNNSDSIVPNIESFTFPTLSRSLGVISVNPSLHSDSLGGSAPADSAYIFFSMFQNGLASGRFYIRAHTVLAATGSLVADSVTDGQFINIPITYTVL